MSDSEFPFWLQSLARSIARDCANPGRYTIHLDRPHYHGKSTRATISKDEVLRDYDLPQKSAPKKSEQL